MSNGEYPEDLQSALENVRRMRDLVDQVRGSHPMRMVMRPMMLYGLAVGPFMVAFCVISQQILDSSSNLVWGFTKSTWLWGFGIVFLVANGIIKNYIVSVISRRKGYDLLSVWKKIFNAGYLRIILPLLVILAVGSYIIAPTDQAHMLVGFITVVLASVVIAQPLTMPLPEMTIIGIYMMITGIISLFVLPDYPFYKLAVIWGGVCGIMGGIWWKMPRENSEVGEDNG